MGYGLGALPLGAKMGCKDKIVINVAGDGCFPHEYMNEIATATRHNIPIIQVVINNHVLGMVRRAAVVVFYGRRYSATVLNDAVDFVACRGNGGQRHIVCHKEGGI